jgi:Lrp/AsnC family transcriptional regulator, leucine-responsive regulatory protein
LVRAKAGGVSTGEAVVALPSTSLCRRFRVLEENGVIARYAAILEASKVEMGLTVFARVYLTGQGEDQVSHFIEEIGKLSQVVECHLMAGDCDFLLRVVAEDLGACPSSGGIFGTNLIPFAA